MAALVRVIKRLISSSALVDEISGYSDLYADTYAE